MAEQDTDQDMMIHPDAALGLQRAVSQGRVTPEEGLDRLKQYGAVHPSVGLEDLFPDYTPANMAIGYGAVKPSNQTMGPNGAPRGAAPSKVQTPQSQSSQDTAQRNLTNPGGAIPNQMFGKNVAESMYEQQSQNAQRMSDMLNMERQIRAQSPLAMGVDLSPGIALGEIMTGKPGGLEAYQKSTAKPQSFDQQANQDLQQQAMIQKPFNPAMALGMSRLDALNNYRQQMLGLRTDTVAANAAKGIQQAPLVQNLQQRIQQIRIDQSNLQDAIQSGQPLTTQRASELAQGIATALSGAKSAGFGMTNKQEYDSLEGNLAHLGQYLTGKPMDAVPAEFKTYLASMLKQLEHAYTVSQGALANQYMQGRNYSHTPEAQTAIKQAVGSLQPGKNAPQINTGGYDGSTKPPASASPAMLEMRRQYLLRKQQGQ